MATSANLSADLQTYFSKALLKQAKYRTILDQFGYKEAIPAHSSKTISFTQYPDLTPATTPLTEGTPPTATGLTNTAITATIDQYGAYIPLTDLADLTPKHIVDGKVMEILSVQAARTYDLVINSVVVAGTNVIYAGGAANRAGLAASNVITFATEVRKAVTLLRKNGAQPFDDGNYVMVVDPSAEADLEGDTVFANTVYRQSDPAKKNELYTGSIVSFAGVTVVRSNNIPTITSTTTVHTSYVFGQDAFAVSDLQTLKMYTQNPGSISDPLEQIMTLGWKVGMKSVILNNNFMVRIESGSSF